MEIHLDTRQTDRGPHTTPGVLKSLDTTTFSALLSTSCRILGHHTQSPPEPMGAQPWEEDQTRPAAAQTPASLAGHWRTRENLLVSQEPTLSVWDMCCSAEPRVLCLRWVNVRTWQVLLQRQNWEEHQLLQGLQLVALFRLICEPTDPRVGQTSPVMWPLPLPSSLTDQVSLASINCCFAKGDSWTPGDSRAFWCLMTAQFRDFWVL